MFNIFQKKKYNVLLWGSGIVAVSFREKLEQSNRVSSLYTYDDFHNDCGLSESYLTNGILEREDIDKMIAYAKERNVDVFINDWDNNMYGVMEDFEAAGIPCIGVNKKWAKVEIFKELGKIFMMKNGIKTAEYVLVQDLESFKANINKFGYPVVVKADGPALGLGVYICKNEEEAFEAYNILTSGEIYFIQNRIIIERFIQGDEVALVSLWDGKTLLPLIPMKDYKLRYEGNKGLNTGSMGQYCPYNLSSKQRKQVKDYLNKLEFIMRKFKVNYKGAIYSALMLTDDGAYCLEYNMRIGLTEGPLFTLHSENDFGDMLDALINQKLSSLRLKWRKGLAACVNIVNKDYPCIIKQEVSVNLSAIDKIKEKGIKVFPNYASVERDGKLFRHGQIFLCLAKSSKNPISEIYDSLKSFNFEEEFENCDYRSDIGS